MRAHYWDDEDSNGSFEDHPSLTTLGSANPAFVIAKIVWIDTGVDTITMSFLLSGMLDGQPVYRARQVLLQGEELMLPPQSRPEVVFVNGFE